MKKTILFAALAATTFAGSALAQTTTTPPAGTMPPSSVTNPMANPPAAMPSTTGTTTVSPSATAPTGHPTVMIDRQKTGDAMSSDLVGAAVYAANGERVGDVNDLLIDTTGRISGVVIGVGGFLGMGEKNVAVDYASVQKGKDDNGRARLTVHLTRDALKSATAFVAMKKS